MSIEGGCHCGAVRYATRERSALVLAALTASAALMLLGCAPALGREQLSAKLEMVAQSGEGVPATVRLRDIFGSDVRAMCSVTGYAGPGTIAAYSDPSVDLSGLLSRMSVRSASSDDTDVYVFDARGRLRERYALGGSSKIWFVGVSACHGPETMLEITRAQGTWRIVTPDWRSEGGGDAS